MDAIPFSLYVPGQDTVSFTRIGSTRFRFRGLLHLQEHALLIEWSGTAKVDEVQLFAIRNEVVPLPQEALDVPLDRLLSVELAGGWWRPYIELIGNDLDALRVVPGEDHGRLRCLIHRRHLVAAGRLVGEVLRRKAARTLPAASTPPDGS